MLYNFNRQIFTGRRYILTEMEYLVLNTNRVSFDKFLHIVQKEKKYSKTSFKNRSPGFW